MACLLGVTAVGASAVLLPRFSVAGVLGELRRGDASFTLLGGVPTTYSALLDAVRGEEGGKDGGRDGVGLGAPALRGCVSAGAAAGPGFRESFEAIFRVPYLEHYGSTEAGPVTMAAPGEATASGACGRVLPGTRVRVGGGSDGRDTGEGELWVSGPGGMAGYHGRPEATAEVLRDGWFRTGDLVSIDASGELAVTGRASDLIIRGGVNIHPSKWRRCCGGFRGWLTPPWPDARTPSSARCGSAIWSPGTAACWTGGAFSLLCLVGSPPGKRNGR